MIMKVVICGAGPVGALAALYAAERGFEVELYELRKETADENNEKSWLARKSINLTLSERGLAALQGYRDDTILQDVLRLTMPVYSREVHGIDRVGRSTSKRIRYDVNGKSLKVVERNALREILLRKAMALPNVRAFFNRKLVSADLSAKVALFRDTAVEREDQSGAFIRISFDLLIGADGAHSAVRQYLAKTLRMDFSQKWIDTQWCEFHIGGAADGGAKLNTDASHVWPQQDFIFLALPNTDNTFTCNLFAPGPTFQNLQHKCKGDMIVEFFNHNFPGVIPGLLTPMEVIEQFSHAEPQSLCDLRVSPIGNSKCCVLLGDAAHTMVPFYAQGLNTGLEDVRILFQEFIDKTAGTRSIKALPDGLLAKYSNFRQPDVATMNSFALAHYTELRQSTKSIIRTARRTVEEQLQAQLPSLGWKTLYSRVAFSCERFTDIERQARRQSLWLILAAIAVSLLLLTWLSVGLVVHKGYNSLTV